MLHYRVTGGNAFRLPLAARQAFRLLLNAGGAGVLVLASYSAHAAEPPLWAYPLNRPGAAQPAADDLAPKHVPGSTVTLTAAQIAGRDGVPDWRPNEHPPMPAVVARGRPPTVRACAYCHLPNGAGRPENAALAGESAGYIKQQVINFRNGDRNGSQPRRVPQNLMLQLAKAVTDAELEQAATYFSKLPAVSFVKVKESATAPKTMVSGGMLMKAPKGGTEPIGKRIIEVPDDSARAQNRDPDVTYTAYVPPGSLAKGKELVTSETGDKTIACKECHGDDLKGDGETVPWIAGRSPSYIMRQLFDIQNGTRAGTAVPMKMVVEKLNLDDMIAIAAYVASLKP
jgi:cytochrome c553